MMSKYNQSALTSWLIRPAIKFALILIGLLNRLGAGRQTKASASEAHGALFSSGVAAQGISIEGSLHVGQNADGRLEVFARGSDGALWHIWQVAPNSGWSGWYSLGTPGIEIGDRTVARNADGRLEVFVSGADGAF